MDGDQDGWGGLPGADAAADGTSTAPIRPPADGRLGGPLDVDDPPPESESAEALGGDHGGRFCAYCGRPVPAEAGRDALFCGDAHRSAYDREIARGDADDDSAQVRALTQDVDRLAELVSELTATAAALGERLDGEVRDVLARAEDALAEARAARRAAAEA
ncbi:MAG: hypothetical protein IRY90_09180, partial [Actinomadura rubrobrunea]|nr:hypothetical protein [Actinomadura rubrobrunea]